MAFKFVEQKDVYRLFSIGNVIFNTKKTRLTDTGAMLICSVKTYQNWREQNFLLNWPIRAFQSILTNLFNVILVKIGHFLHLTINLLLHHLGSLQQLLLEHLLLCEHWVHFFLFLKKIDFSLKVTKNENVTHQWQWTIATRNIYSIVERNAFPEVALFMSASISNDFDTLHEQ